ncbi:MAG TPA: glycerol-3-phosphate acyltransferase [Dehalococcoidales bacterium]|nr:glycerol-3-phosphate acyltransferase [Dehalococcoidales bacterium]
MAIWFALILVAYLLGSFPAAYLTAKVTRGIDIRQYGTGQVGGGNLWRMTSWKLGLPVGAFDVGKGMVMVWVAQLLGMSVAQQLVVGAAAVIGHNWSVFLRFGGGRGVATAMGVILILPLINEMTPWPTITCFACLVAGSVMLRSSPLPVMVSVTSLPIVSAIYEPVTTTLGFLAILLIMVTKRLVAPRAAEATSVSKKVILLNRLLFDRDIMDRKVWMSRLPFKAKDLEELSDGID